MSEPASPTAINTGRPITSRRTIMVAVDGSDHSKYAFKWSLDNIIRSVGEDWVLLVTCKGGDVKGAAYAELDLTESTDEKKNEEVEKAERSRLKNLLATYQSELSARLIPAKAVVLKGDPRQALVGFANDMHTDIMIMGSRGMGALKKAFIGSVSDYCVKNAGLPVLIVRKPAN